MKDSGIASIRDSFTVYARPSKGFFGLTELETFTKLNVDPYAKAKSEATLILDFSTVRLWDIAAIVWMVVALDHYRRNAGLSFLLRLPEERPGMSVSDRDDFARSADYLRRWRFDRGLQNIDADVANILVPEQRDYFNPAEPRRFYIAAKIRDESHLAQSLMSRRLTEIRCLSDPSFTGSTPISPERISQCIREFQAERIGDILTVQCGIEKRKADLFADHLLTEALLNVQEHPNATIGLVAISLMGRTKELILTVVDNGDSIPQTIFPRYLSDNPYEGYPATAAYDRSQLTDEQKGKIAHHATKPGVTRKTGPEAQNAGMGLTYIREDSVNAFHGKLTIVTDGVKLTYADKAEAEPERSEWSHAWRGNLVRIAIPTTGLPRHPTPLRTVGKP